MTPSKPDFAYVCLFVMGTFGIVGVPGMAMVNLVSGAALIERHCVAEIADGGIGVREREGVRYNADGTDGIPAQHIVFKTYDEKELRKLPSPKEVYPDIDGEGLLKLFTLFPSKLVFASVHLICEGDLLVVPRG
jgi:hypothetical protein